MKPNLFLVGAAKSGTTALATFLAENPAVFLPYVKEPSWWSRKEFHRAQATVKLETLADYEALYADADESRHTYVMDGSTNYLMCRQAIPDIVAYQPDARFIVSLRDPVKMAQAFHMEVVFNAMEDVADFETAWELQEARARGEKLPRRCPEPKRLQYRDICSLGSQVERLLEHAPRDNLLILFQQDMLDKPAETWERIFAFLDIPPHDFDVTRRIAPAHFHRFPWLARFYQQPPKALAPAIRGGKRWLGAMGATGLAKKALARTGQRPPLSPEFESRLRASFAPEVEKLEVLTGRSLDAWR